MTTKTHCKALNHCPVGLDSGRRCPKTTLDQIPMFKQGSEIWCHILYKYWYPKNFLKEFLECTHLFTLSLLFSVPLWRASGWPGVPMYIIFYIVSCAAMCGNARNDESQRYRISPICSGFEASRKSNIWIVWYFFTRHSIYIIWTIINRFENSPHSCVVPPQL